MDKPLYHAQLEATVGDETNCATIREQHKLELDEPTWSDRGEDLAPCPVDYLLVGVAGCQLESLRHCLERSHVDDYRINTSVEGEYRIPGNPESGVPEPSINALTSIHLSIEISTTSELEGRVRRCLDIAEEKGCIVSRTVEEGVDVPLRSSVRIQTDGE